MKLIKLNGYDNYYVSDDGYVYSGTRMLAPRISKDGYNNVYLYKGEEIMIAWNILGWMLVIIVGVICLPIFIALIYAAGYAAGYVLFWILLFLFAIYLSICEQVKSIFHKVKSIFAKDNNRDANKI